MSTSPILLAEVGEAPDIAKSHAEAEDGEEELDGAVPGDPGLLLHLDADPLLALVLPHDCPVTHWWRLPCASLPPPLLLRHGTSELRENSKTLKTEHFTILKDYHILEQGLFVGFRDLQLS